MTRGFKTPPEKVEQTILLAKAGMPNAEIIKLLGISRRQVGRILKKAEIKRKVGKSARGRRTVSIIQTPVMETSLDPLQIARKREHSDYLRKQLKNLMANIFTPRTENVFIWPGETELVASSSSVSSQRQGPSLKLTVAEDRVEVKPAIETTEDWHFLKSHLASESNPPALEDYTQWLTDLGLYLNLCYRTLSKVVAKANGRINELMSKSPGWQGVKIVEIWGVDPGIHRWFYEDVYSLGLGRRQWGYEITAMPEDKSGLVYLCRAARTLSLSTGEAAKAFESVYKTMRDEVPGWPEVNNLKNKYERCAAGGRALHSKLSIIEKRGDFQGECDICRPWRLH